jgi:hypothetical protein
MNQLLPGEQKAKRERVHGMDTLQKRVQKINIFGHVLETRPSHAHVVYSKDRAKLLHLLNKVAREFGESC